MRESPILHSVRAFLASQPDVTLWRCNGGVDTAKGVRYGLGKGAADLIGIITVPALRAGHQVYAREGDVVRINDALFTRVNYGRFLAIEIKAPQGRLSAEQKLWGAAVQRAGGFYAVARSIPEAHAALDRARSGAVS